MIPRLARVLVLPALLAAGVAVAQDASSPPPGAMQVRKACAADIQRLCPDAQPGHGGLRMCLRDHQNDLSDDCRSALAAMRQHRPHGQGQGPDAGAPPSSPESSPQS
jgi:Cysteine rich repeat